MSLVRSVHRRSAFRLVIQEALTVKSTVVESLRLK